MACLTCGDSVIDLAQGLGIVITPGPNGLVTIAVDPTVFPAILDIQPGGLLAQNNSTPGVRVIELTTTSFRSALIAAVANSPTVTATANGSGQLVLNANASGSVVDGNGIDVTVVGNQAVVSINAGEFRNILFSALQSLSTPQLTVTQPSGPGTPVGLTLNIQAAVNAAISSSLLTNLSSTDLSITQPGGAGNPILLEFNSGALRNEVATTTIAPIGPTSNVSASQTAPNTAVNLNYAPSIHADELGGATILTVPPAGTQGFTLEKTQPGGAGTPILVGVQSGNVVAEGIDPASEIVVTGGIDSPRIISLSPSAVVSLTGISAFANNELGPSAYEVNLTGINPGDPTVVYSSSPFTLDPNRNALAVVMFAGFVEVSGGPWSWKIVMSRDGTPVATMFETAFRTFPPNWWEWNRPTVLTIPGDYEWSCEIILSPTHTGPEDLVVGDVHFSVPFLEFNV